MTEAISCNGNIYVSDSVTGIFQFYEAMVDLNYLSNYVIPNYYSQFIESLNYLTNIVIYIKKNLNKKV